ncbi:Sec1-like family protein [Tieghemostelium lacteum]|uniref:Sec1-like family protein n=1 Tax=Tieghemostelium lacteum TaxID=361077 RepID=A0A151Z617_TIELA|nr:Sec1-like family protein [Tieghemostelium lacteum]|eukprot:KYQ89401.1 Sec1-like family protein [Tieghemostelium lacteum]
MSSNMAKRDLNISNNEIENKTQQGPLNTEDWIKLKKLQFWSIIDSFKINFVQEKTILVIDKKLVGLFSLIFTMDQLKEKGIRSLSYFEEQLSQVDDTKHIIYLCRPRLELIPLLSIHMKSYQSRSQMYLMALPKLEFSFSYLLEKEGLLGLLKTVSFDIGFIPYDTDLLSLELTDFYSRSFVENDNYQIETIARSIIQLEQLYGPFQNIIGKGTKSKLICDYLLPAQDTLPPFESSQMKTLILLDRNIDVLPMLLTQQTYQGLIDEIFTISSGCSIMLDEDDQIDQQQQQPPRTRKVILDSKDILFSNIKNFNFSTIPAMLHNNALLLNDNYQSIKPTNNMSIPDLKRLVSKIPSIQSQKDAINLHTIISERLLKTVKFEDFQNRIQFEYECLLSTSDANNKSLEYIQNMIIRRKPMYQILRLICIYCLTFGMSAKVYQSMIKDFIHVYEYESVPILLRLEKSGLIGPKETLALYNNYQILRKQFKLTNNSFDQNNNNVTSQSPNTDDVTYSGYVPSITRIIERGQQQRQTEWKNILESKLLPINNSPYFQYNLKSTAKYNENSSTVIFFVGGVSYSELASLRHLKNIYGKGVGYDFLFATTNIANSTSFLMNI